MVQLVKIYCGEVRMTEQIWGFVASDKVFGSWDR